MANVKKEVAKRITALKVLLESFDKEITENANYRSHCYSLTYTIHSCGQLFTQLTTNFILATDIRTQRSMKLTIGRIIDEYEVMRKTGEYPETVDHLDYKEFDILWW